MIHGLIATPHLDLHRERCAKCGRIFLTLVGESYWRNPLYWRKPMLCPTCKRKIGKQLSGKR